MATAKSNVRDEVAEILKGLNLDKNFFSQKLSSDRAQRLVPVNPDGSEPPGRRRSARISQGENAPAIGTGFRRRPSMVARRFPDFDVYLTEALMPVLAQALDALGRQVSRMKSEKLDERVRARFNPITWLAQQLLRRHPREANTPRRISLYRSFKDWADQERGRRELLRSKSKVLEVFNGFMQNGVVGRNSLASIVAAVDDSFYLGGALKDSKLVQEHFEGAHARGRLGGDELIFEQFWFKLANVVVAHNGILLSSMQEGRRMQKIREEEQKRQREAARIAEEQRRKEEKENLRLMSHFSDLHARMSEDEGLKNILAGKRLTGEYLKPSDEEYASQALPHGSHVLLLEELMKLLGLKTAKEAGGQLEVEELQQRLFRQKVQKDHEDEVEEKGKDGKEKENEKRSKTAKRGSKEPREEESPFRRQESGRSGRGSASESPGKGSRAASKNEEPRKGSKGEERTGSKGEERTGSKGEERKGSKGEEARKRGSANSKRGSKEDMTKRGSKEDMSKRGSKQEVKRSKETTKEDRGSKPGSKEEAEPVFNPDKDRWWDSSLKRSWKVLQAALEAEGDGVVTAEVLQKITPEGFVSLKKKVDSEQQRIADGIQDEKRETVVVAVEKKPTMEELSVKYGMSTARLAFFHELFESFLPAQEDGSPGVCGYPEKPSMIDKKTMFLLLKQIQPGIKEEEFEARFRRIDGDRSGVIEFDEFVEWVYDDEVEVVGSAEKVKRSFEELAMDMDVSIKLIMYVYECFKFEIGDQVDEYPKLCASLDKEHAYTLAQILVSKLEKKRFNKYWDMVDIDQKGSVQFDDFCELLDFEDMPDDVLEKYNAE